MGLKKASDFGGAGTFFKGEEHSADLALLVEPKSWRYNDKNTYQGQLKPRDEATCDITCFQNSDQLEGKKPPLVLEGAILTNEALVNKAKQSMGDSFIAVLRKPSGKRYWNFEDPDDDTYEKVAAYYEAREAKLAEALANVPSFDD